MLDSTGEINKRGREREREREITKPLVTGNEDFFPFLCILIYGIYIFFLF